MALTHAQPLDAIDLHATEDSSGVAVSDSELKSRHLQMLRVVDGLRHTAGTPPAWQSRHPVSLRDAEVVVPARTCGLDAGAWVSLLFETPHG